MKKSISILLILVLLFTTGCVEKKTIQKQERNYLICNLGKLPKDLFLLQYEGERKTDLLGALFEGLIKNGGNGEIVPALASSWVVSQDGITYTFKIREGAQWSDGIAIEAKDFVDFFSQVLAYQKNNIYAEQLYYIFGAKEYSEGKKKLDGLAIRAVDSKTLEIRLNAPCPYFLDILGQPIFYLRKLKASLANYQKEYSQIQYSGPFTIQSVSANGELELRKNERYWDAAEVKSNKILISTVQDSENALAAFETGKIDVLTEVPISENGRLLAEQKGIAIPIDCGYGIVFNFRNSEISKDYNFRKSISYIMNREDIVENVLNTAGTVAETYVPLNDKKNREQKMSIYYESDILKSKSYLAKSYYDKKDTIELIYLDEPKNKRICERIIGRMEKNLEVKVDATPCTVEEWEEKIEKGQYDMAAIEYDGLFNDSIAFLEQWTSNSVFNTYGYQNKEYDAKIGKAKIEKDIKKRKEIITDCEAMLVKDVPIVPIYFDSVVVCRSKNVEGVEVTNKGNLQLNKIYVNESAAKADK